MVGRRYCKKKKIKIKKNRTEQKIITPNYKRLQITVARTIMHVPGHV